MDIPSLADALSLADKYGIGWVFALGEALLLVIGMRAFIKGTIVPGSALAKAEKQRDELTAELIKTRNSLDRNSTVMENLKPAELTAPGDQDGGG